MKISTKGRYAVRVMMDIAEHDGGEEFVKANQISARQGISAKYLEQIIAILNKAGYVSSVRGAQGGYKLAQPADAYTVGMILRLTEGSLFRWHAWMMRSIPAADVTTVNRWKCGNRFPMPLIM